MIEEVAGCCRVQRIGAERYNRVLASVMLQPKQGNSPRLALLIIREACLRLAPVFVNKTPQR